MPILPLPLQQLIDELGKLPGIGPKSAARLAFHLLKKSQDDNSRLGKTIVDFKKDLVFCAKCNNITIEDPCMICDNKDRNQNLILVVEEPLDVVAFERTGEFEGLYHVLHGVMNPIEGIGPDKLKIRELIDRLNNLKEETEVILATNPSLDGEATADYIYQHISKLPNLKVTRIARGLPVGGDLEYADEVTLSQSLKGRRAV